MSDPTQDQPAERAPLLAIGLYIGALLALYGLILLFYGWLGSPDNSKSLGHPFDIWWGAVMLVVGLIVAALGYAGKRVSARAAASGTGEKPQPSGGRETGPASGSVT